MAAGAAGAVTQSKTFAKGAVQNATTHQITITNPSTETDLTVKLKLVKTIAGVLTECEYTTISVPKQSNVTKNIDGLFVNADLKVYWNNDQATTVAFDSKIVIEEMG